MTRQIEIKLRISPKELALVQEHALLKALPSILEHVTSDYYDTNDFFIRQRGGALKIRRSDQENRVAYQCASRIVGGLVRRQEYEFPIQGDTVSQPLLSKIDLNLNAADLSVIFTTKFSRQAWDMPFGDHTQIICELDQGNVNCQNKQLEFCEFKLKLKKGNIDDLYECAFELLSKLPLGVEYLSKASRGYWLASKKPTLPEINYFVLGDVGHLTERDTRHLMEKIFVIWQRSQMILQLENNKEAFFILREAMLDFKRIILRSELSEKYDYVKKLWDQIVTGQKAFEKKLDDKKYNQFLLEVQHYISTIPQEL